MSRKYFSRLIVNSKTSPVSLQKSDGGPSRYTVGGQQKSANVQQNAVHLAAARGHANIILALLRELDAYMRVSGPAFVNCAGQSWRGSTWPQRPDFKIRLIRSLALRPPTSPTQRYMDGVADVISRHIVQQTEAGTPNTFPSARRQLQNLLVQFLTLPVNSTRSSKFLVGKGVVSCAVSQSLSSPLVFLLPAIGSDTGHTAAHRRRNGL